MWRPPAQRTVTFEPRGDVIESILMRDPLRLIDPARRTIGIGVRYGGWAGGAGWAGGIGTW